jgi:S-formylglutathione hydrolase FrmB
MSLLGLPLLLALSGALVGALGATVVCWDRWPGSWAWPARVLGLLLVMVLPVAVAGDAVNRYYGFYTSWRELVSSPSDVRPTAIAQSSHQQVPGAVLAEGVADAAQGRGTMIPWTLAGPRSGIIRGGYVYLPAAYFDKTRPAERFPVIEMLHGYTGSPRTWLGALPMASILNQEIAAGRLPPVIAVAPAEYDHNDGECVNAVGGEQNETYLAQDVPSDLDAAFRTATAPASWATLGFSTGGFCAVNMALHNPNRYRAAASLSGYFTAITDNTTGDLYHGNEATRLYNSPQWFVTHHPVRPSLYVFASSGDADPYAQVKPFAAAVPGDADLTVVTVPVGGHNTTVWKAALPPAVDWLGQRLPAPTDAALTERGSSIVPAPPGTSVTPRSPTGVTALRPISGRRWP